ncbi:MAG: hypothetical protein LBS28_04265 [Streptococcaceae bacterium]|jgi:hypothetical protein|nr:hypothetical protein [Streptococcaceae bacterium]
MKLKKAVVFLTALASVGGFAAFSGGHVEALSADIYAALTPEQKSEYDSLVSRFTPTKIKAMDHVIQKVYEKGRLSEVSAKAFATQAEKLSKQDDAFIEANFDQIDAYVDQVIANKDNGNRVVLDDLLEVRFLYRLLNPNSPFKIHHITDSWPEVEKLEVAGWTYEGIVGAYNVRGGGAPIYRLYNSNSPWGEHLITPDWNEATYLISASEGAWKLEGGNETVDKGETRLVAFFIPNILIGRDLVTQRGPVFAAMYRIYNKLNGGEHFYTMNWNEVVAAEELGWVYEGIVWLYR